MLEHVGTGYVTPLCTLWVYALTMQSIVSNVHCECYTSSSGFIPVVLAQMSGTLVMHACMWRLCVAEELMDYAYMLPLQIALIAQMLILFMLSYTPLKA